MAINYQGAGHSRGSSQVYYDPQIGYYTRESVSRSDRNDPGVYYVRNTSNATPTMATLGAPNGTYYRNVPIGDRQTTQAPPQVDFNALPQQTLPQAQAYVRPNAPAQSIGSGYRPQFDPTFIQQMLAQRFGNQQPNTGIPAAVRPPIPTGPATLTPGAAQTYGGIQGQGGLAALRGIAGPAPVAPNGGIPNAT